MPDFSGVQVFTCNLRSARPLELRLTTQGQILRDTSGGLARAHQRHARLLLTCH